MKFCPFDGLFDPMSFTLCQVFYRLSFDPLAFDCRSFDPMSMNPVYLSPYP